MLEPSTGILMMLMLIVFASFTASGGNDLV